PVRALSWPAADRPGPGGRISLASGGSVPGRQGAVRPGPAPGPPLALLVPVGDPGHAGLRLPGGGRSHRARPPPTTVGAHPVDLQRDPAPVRRPGRRPRCGSRPPVALVVVATPLPSPRSCLPLPTASRPAAMKITISGGSTNAHKTGYVAEPTKVMAAKLGRPLAPFEEVHHRNGIRSDNRP